MTSVELPFDLATLEVPDELTLVVGWKRRDGFAGGEMRVAASVASHLRAACEETIKRVSASERRLYTPDMHLEEEEVLVAADPDQVADSPLAEIVLPTEPLPLINAQS